MISFTTAQLTEESSERLRLLIASICPNRQTSQGWTCSLSTGLCKRSIHPSGGAEIVFFGPDHWAEKRLLADVWNKVVSLPRESF
jgi:hypothetical protein